MRFLANENFPFDAVEVLRQNGHDVVWIRTEAPGISDPEILKRAQNDDRILLTFDKDFGELAFRSQLPATSDIILFRIRCLRMLISANQRPRYTKTSLICDRGRYGGKNYDTASNKKAQDQSDV